MISDRFLYAIGIWLVILCLVMSCRSTSKQHATDRSILTDDPCAAPCWQGITPGQTTLDEAFDILTKLGYEPHRVGNWESQIGWHSPASYPESVLQRGTSELFSLPTAGHVGFLNVVLEFDLTLGEVLDKYGSPEKYHVYKSEGALVGGGHTPIVVAVFYYVQQGLAFISWVPILEPDAETVIISSDTPLTRVYYFVPTSFAQLFDDVLPLKWKVEGQLTLEDWQGLPIEFRWRDSQ